jgi:hypothetical protein
MSERAAEQAEKQAFEKVRKLLPVKKVIASPAGSATNFPDFGFRIVINKKNVDLHFEYKMDYKAPMGSMRDWVFDGTNFNLSASSTSESDPNKQLLIDVMNSSSKAKTEAKRLLKDLQTYFSANVKRLHSGSLVVITDKKERKDRLYNFSTNTDNTQIANISSSILGDQIKKHYHKKFHANLQRDADYSILFFMIGTTIWFVEDTGTLPEPDKLSIAKYFGKNSISVLPALTANLEVRISPRPGAAKTDPKKFWASNTNPHLDVLASFRLQSKPSGGVTI